MNSGLLYTLQQHTFKIVSIWIPGRVWEEYKINIGSMYIDPGNKQSLSFDFMLGAVLNLLAC